MRILPPTGLLAAIVAVAFIGTGCGDDEADSEPQASAPAQAAAGTYVGMVERSDAYLALISDGERVAGYLCDGKELSAWLSPIALEEGAAELRSRVGERLGEVSFSGEGAAGEVELAGEPHQFALEPASGEAGLYRAVVGDPGEPGSVEAGWIVLADGWLRGAKKSFIAEETDVVVAPAPEFNDSAGDLAVDLGAGTGTTEVRKLDANFMETGADI